MKRKYEFSIFDTGLEDTNWVLELDDAEYAAFTAKLDEGIKAGKIHTYHVEEYHGPDSVEKVLAAYGIPNA